MRRLLADTHILLWSMREVHRIPPEIRAELDLPEVQPLFSAISIWEIAIKANLERPDFTIEATKVRSVLLRDGWQQLDFTGAHAIAAGALPRLHRDPFDRAIVGQALAEQITLITRDTMLGRYDTLVKVV